MHALRLLEHVSMQNVLNICCTGICSSAVSSVSFTEPVQYDMKNPMTAVNTGTYRADMLPFKAWEIKLLVWIS